MKKLFLLALCAGLFVACGNKNAKTEQATDTTVVEEVVAPVEEEAVVAEEAPVQEAAPAPAKTTAKKQTVKEHAQQAAENVANAAIDKAEQDATNSMVNTGKKRR
ncbi:MAG: hypothetical protein K5846_04990 [Bacteroidales bacterium]|nr:hypothetical protein [Bacteroidales bacterium]